MKMKKGLTLSAAPMAVMTIVLIAIVAVVGVKINAQLQSSETAGTSTYLAIENSTAGIQQVTSQLSLIGLIVIMAVVIGVLWASFGGMFSRGGGL